MSIPTRSFDPLWEDLYGHGKGARAPYDYVASFLYRHAPKSRPRSEVKVLEVGCGFGNNLWFAALEGFDVSGVDASSAAIEGAKNRLAEFGLTGSLHVADFTSLPFGDSEYDLVIDRGALTCCGTESIHKAISEISRVLKAGGAFLFNPISDSDTSYRAGEPYQDDLRINITHGDYKGVGQIRFVSRSDIDSFLRSEQWKFERIERVEIVDMLNPAGKITSQWRVEALKK